MPPNDGNRGLPGPQSGGFPYPYGGGPIIIQERGNDRPEPQRPPLRVLVASQFLSQLTAKQMPQVAATETSIETIPGLKPTEDEQGTAITALNMLSHYFAGDLKPDQWEQLGMGQMHGIPTLEFRCICHREGMFNPECPLCGGQGTMDCVVKNPRKAMVDNEGKVVAQGQFVNSLHKTGPDGTYPPAPNVSQRKPPVRPDTE